MAKKKPSNSFSTNKDDFRGWTLPVVLLDGPRPHMEGHISWFDSAPAPGGTPVHLYEIGTNAYLGPFVFSSTGDSAQHRDVPRGETVILLRHAGPPPRRRGPAVDPESYSKLMAALYGTILDDISDAVVEDMFG